MNGQNRRSNLHAIRLPIFPDLSRCLAQATIKITESLKDMGKVREIILLDMLIEPELNNKSTVSGTRPFLDYHKLTLTSRNRLTTSTAGYLRL